MESQKTIRQLNKLLKSGWSKRALGICANHPDCHNHREKGSKFCNECSIEYYNEHKDD